MILALDISKTCTGIAYGVAGDTPKVLSLDGSQATAEAAALRLGDWLIAFIKVSKPDFVAYEAPLAAVAVAQPEIDWEARSYRLSQNPNTVIVLAEMTGIVKFVCGKAKVPARPVNVQTARKEFIGRGNLAGPEAKKRVRAMCSILGWPARNYDESDALCVWHYGTCLHDKRNARPILPSDHAKAATLAAGNMRRSA